MEIVVIVVMELHDQFEFGAKKVIQLASLSRSVEFLQRLESLKYTG